MTSGRAIPNISYQHNAGQFTENHPEAPQKTGQFDQSHPEAQQRAGQFQESHPDAEHDAQQFQQTHPDADQNAQQLQCTVGRNSLGSAAECACGQGSLRPGPELGADL